MKRNYNIYFYLKNLQDNSKSIGVLNGIISSFFSVVVTFLFKKFKN